MEKLQHQPVPDAASAGRPGATRKPALLQLDQDALSRVLAKLEPEALAIAGLHKHSTCLRDFAQEPSPRARGEAGRPFWRASSGLLEVSACFQLAAKYLPCRLCQPLAPHRCRERAAMAAALHRALEEPKQAPTASRCRKTSLVSFAWHLKVCNKQTSFHLTLRKGIAALKFCSPVLVKRCLLCTSIAVLAGRAEVAEVTWRSLYACSNGWRGVAAGLL